MKGVLLKPLGNRFDFDGDSEMRMGAQLGIG
jgi:hypothetical protein